MENKKRVNEEMLNKFLASRINSEYGYNFNHRDIMKILDAIQMSMESLVEECYNFKLLGLNFNMVRKKGRLFKDIRNDVIKYSRPYYSLEIKPTHRLKERIKKETKHDTDEEPLRSGLTNEEYYEALSEWKQRYLENI